MASTIPESQLDNDIAAIRAQIAILSTQKALLSTALLSSPQIHLRLQRAPPTPQLTSALEITKTQTNTNTTNLYNSLAGITSFRVQDPDPNAVDNGKVLGARIDIFSSSKRKFETPYYILMNQPEGEGGRLRIHKHTIPICVPVKALGEKYLPYPDEDEEGAEKRRQDVGRFLRAVRRECVSLHKRVEAVQMLKEELGREQGVLEVRALDTEGREAEIEFMDKHIARISIATDGTIEKVIVRHISPGTEASIRRKAIERIIKAGDNKIDSLTTRLIETSPT
ncbi:putative cenp-o kinetochore centromere component protein [Venturia nashicola]|uniref:Putative cenp-o kinetochore centromere component protein n=1 Tax=Venturia nashicola TaxID=86259 RepID=A0A4Z1NJN5_9PEZI|nr:putative cenp-o kinetochore centromere component protein [Venturia nashicola]